MVRRGLLVRLGLLGDPLGVATFPIEEGPRNVPPVVPNDAWHESTRPRRCGRLRLRRHIDVVADPALPGRFTCVRCGVARYRIHGRDVWDPKRRR